MGRRKKYATEAERLRARRETARRSYHRRRAEQNTDDEFSRLLRMNPDLYPTRSKLTNEQKEFISTLMSMPLDTSPPTKRTTRRTNSVAKQQLGLATSKIRDKKRTKIKSIDFDTTKLKTEEERQYFFENLPGVISRLLDSINFSSERWTVYYKYDRSWKTRTLDGITEQYMRDQVEHDLKEHLNDFITYESDYDFFPVAIQNLTQIRFINIDAMAPPHGTGRRKREGKFWRWLLKDFQEIDLTRFMIFHELTRETVSLINRDSCFVYACQMAGLEEERLNDIRYAIQKRSLATADIHRVAEACDLCFRVKTPSHRYTINPTGGTVIKLLLMHGHYMISERVHVSPFYVLNRRTIYAHPVAKFWKLADKMTVIGFDENNKPIQSKGKGFHLFDVLEALFQVNAFEAITMNQFRAFASLICFENIDPIKSLEYWDQASCRLKEDYQAKKLNQLTFWTNKIFSGP